MKKVNFKVVLVALSFAFTFLLGVSSVEAQAGASLTAGGTGVPANKATSAIFSLPQGNFQSPQNALNTLMAEMTSIKTTLATMQDANSPVYIALVKLLNYYNNVHRNITAGQTVSQAIVSGLGVLGSDPGYLTPADLNTLRNAGIQLLD